MSALTVSVIMPVYNVEAYVGTAIASVLAQTFQNFELIIVDDGSTDGSARQIAQFQDARIRLLRQENLGLSAARNTGLRAARGEFVALLDGDDCWHPEKLAQHVSHLKTAPHVGVSYSRSAFMNEQGQLTGELIRSKLRNVSLRDLLLTNPVGNGSSPVLRRATLEAVAQDRRQTHTPQDTRHSELCYFDEALHYAEDIECWARIALRTHWQFEGLATPLTYYRLRQDSLSHQVMHQHESMLFVLDALMSLAPSALAKDKTLFQAAHAHYLARSAIRAGQSDIAKALLRRALGYDWRILKEKPRQTLFILLATYGAPWFQRRTLHRFILG